MEASGCILDAIFGDFGNSFRLLFPTLRKKAAHHEFIGHGDEIDGRAPGKASKKASEIEEKTMRKQAWKNNAFSCNLWYHFFYVDSEK